MSESKRRYKKGRNRVMPLTTGHASRQGAAHLKDGTPQSGQRAGGESDIGASGASSGHGGQRRGRLGQIFPARFPGCLHRRRRKRDPSGSIATPP